MAEGTRVLIIGAGLGGLATAVRLRRRGYHVTVLEKGPRPGGRCNRLELGPYRFDMGPTLLLMPDVLEELFRDAGAEAGDWLTLKQLEPNYSVNFHDGSSLELTSDLALMAERMEAIEPGAGARLGPFLAEAGHHYRVARQAFVERNFTSWGEFLTPGNLRRFVSARCLQKLYPYVSRHFRDFRLRRALTFQTMYLGTSPFESPAIYTLLPYTELVEGIWYPEGGLYSIPEALARLARASGVRIHCDSPVTRVERDGDRVRAVETTTGARFEADVFVANADLPYVYRELLEEPLQRRALPYRYTSSALMFYWGVSTRYPQLRHHNVFLPEPYRELFEQIFNRHEVPEEPAFYVSSPVESDSSVAPPGHSALYALVPAPHLAAGTDWEAETARLRERVLTRLEAAGCRDLRQLIVSEATFTPADFQSSYNLEMGSAFGLSHHFTQVALMRPGNRHRQLRNLYFVGASTQPGTGIPMVFFSSRLVTQRIVADTGAAPSSVAASRAAIRPERSTIGTPPPG